MSTARVPLVACTAVLWATLAGHLAAGPLPAPEGRWTGRLEFRGDTTAVQLEIPGDGIPRQALLDLPELVMHREPIPVERSASGLTIELPFGIGSVALSLRDGTLLGARELGQNLLSLELRPDGGPPLPRRDLQVRRGGVVLKGTLVSPAGPGPYPAVVLVHGSGAATREQWAYRSWAWAMARRGVAGLVYDRRGSGQPPAGEPGFDELAGDALAWVDHLRSLPGIRAGAVGLMGGSQAGWVAPLAASRSDAVAFLVLKSAPGVTPAEQEIRSVVGRARQRGLDEAAIAALRRYLRLYFYTAVSGRGWDLLEDEIRTAAGAPWGGLVDQPENLEQLAWWGRHADLSPASFLPRVSVPVLAAYGTRDLIVPPEANAAILESLLRSGGNRRIHVMVLEEADHRLELPMGVDGEGRWRWPRIDPEFLEAVESWVREVAGAGNVSTSARGGCRLPTVAPRTTPW